MHTSVNFFLVLIFCLSVVCLSGQQSTATTISTTDSPTEWMDWSTMVAQQETKQKRVIMLVYTSWCTWCDRMKHKTLDQATVANYIDSSFYAVKFDAEFKEDIELNEKTYKFQKKGKRGYHELVIELLNGRYAFPTIIFLDENLKPIQSIPGFRSVAEFTPILHYFGEGAYENEPWESFIQRWQTAAAVKKKQEVSDE